MKTTQFFKVFLAGFLMTLCGVLTSHAQWVKANPDKVSLNVGEKKTVNVTFEDGYTNTSVAWTYKGRETVVKSTDTGSTLTVEGIGEGETFISCDVTGTKGTETKTKSFMIDVKVTAPAAESISVNPSTVTVKLGSSKELTPVLKPTNASKDGLTWESDKPEIAKVTTSGIVRGVSKGTATITVKTANGKSGTCTVTVTDQTYPSISLPENKEVVLGETLDLKAEVKAENGATTDGLKWDSNNKTIATVDNDGKVTSVAVGIATITVKTKEGYPAFCVVTVTAPKLKSITLTDVTVKQGDTLDLKKNWKLDPTNASTEGLTWESDKPEIAKVTTSGIVKGVSEGTATITVKVNGNESVKNTCTVTVTAPALKDPTAIKLPAATLEVQEGNPLDLTKQLVLTPANASTTNLTWNSEKTDIATVDASTGVVTGKKASDTEVTITVTSTKDANVKATCKVKVTKPALTKIEIAEQNVNRGETLDLKKKWTLTPTDASTAGLEWTSKNKAIATVVNGVVKGVKVGSTTITVTSTKNKTVTATCTVNVTAPDLIAISLPTTLEIKKSKTENLKAKLEVTPTDASIDGLTFTWKSEETEVATVGASTGVVTGVKEGTAKITVTTTVNGKELTAFCFVTVQPADPVDPVDPTTITAPAEQPKEVKLGATLDMKKVFTFTPEDASKENLTWSSSDPTIAKVDDEGVVTGVKASETEVKITVQSTKDENVKAECKVKVTAPNPTGVSLPTTLNVEVSKTGTLKPTFTPANAAPGKLTWTSSDPTVAKIAKVTATDEEGKETETDEYEVTENGEYKVKALKAGTATITIKVTTANGHELSSFCVVTVVPKAAVEPKEIAGPLGEDGQAKVMEVKQGATLDMKEVFTFTPEDASKENLYWVSSNSGIARIDDKGVVTGVKASDTEVTITVIYNKKADVKATCQVKVTAPDPTDVILPKSIELKQNSFQLLKPTFTPDNAVPGKLTWTSSDPTVADIATVTVTDDENETTEYDVTEKGEYKVNALKTGTTTITVTTENGNKSATCEVTVLAPDPTGIKLPEETVNMVVGEKKTLTPEFEPDDATATGLIWTSSDVTLARVTSKGEVRAINEGTVTIKVMTADSLFTASWTVIIDTDIAALENALYAVNLTSVQTGEETFELPICLKNKDAVTGAGFTVTLPEGMTFAKPEGSDSTAICKLNAERADESKFKVSAKISKETESSCSVTLESNDTESSISGADSELLTLTVKVATDMEIGDYTVRLTKNSMTTNDGKLRLPETRATLKVVEASDENNGDAVEDSFAPEFADADAISDIAADVKNASVRYSLSGQRVGNDYKGIVIVNGKKVLVK